MKHLSPDTTRFNVTGLSSGSTYAFGLYAEDIYGNKSRMLTAAGTTAPGGSSPDPSEPPLPPVSDTVEAVVQNGIARAEINAGVIDALIRDVLENGGNNPAVKVKLEVNGEAGIIELKLPHGSFRDIADKANAGFVLITRLEPLPLIKMR